MSISRSIGRLAGVAAATLAVAASVSAQSIAITEWMYQGEDGEFVEFTNIGPVPVDMTGWSFDDSARLPGAFDLSAFGIVQPGESVILTEAAPEDFRADWALDPSVKIVGHLGDREGNNLGRNDEINLYDASEELADRLTYGDDDFPGTIRTRWFSGNPKSLGAVGANDPHRWVLASPMDVYTSWTSAGNDVGNPGVFTFDGKPPVDLPLFINEIMSSNNDSLMDEDGDFEDWIELHNAGTEPIDLNGFGLSDDDGEPFKWTFPAVTIEAGEFLVVFASNKDRTNPLSELHTNFAIGADGEEILLTHASGVPIDDVEPIAIPTNVSYGRQPDGASTWLFFAEPTPGAPNITDGYTGVSPSVEYSHDAGFYTEGFDLTLTCEDPEAVIYYTLNGDMPTPGGPTTIIYAGPIAIDSREGDPNVISMIPTTFQKGSFAWEPPTGEVFKVTPVRAVAARPNHLPSKPATRTYLVDPDIHNRYTLPVICLNTDAENFFGHEQGIYVPGATFVPGNHNTGNYWQSGDAWERPVHIEFFEDDHTLAFAQNAGVRIHGGTTRRMPQKALRLYARNSYDSDYFEHAIFPDQPQYTAYRRLLLRPSGNDSLHTLFRDAMMQSLAAELGLDVQAYRPAIVFLNGEYWGIHNLRERHDKHYLARTHDIDPDAVDILNDHWRVDEGTSTNYLQMLNFLSNPPFSMPDTDENDLIDDANYEQVRTMMDVDQYAKYVAFQDYTRNTDWPQNNIRFWRPHEDGARWRWLVYDLDLGFGLIGGPTNETFKRLALANQIDIPGTTFYENWATIVFRSLLRNEQFRHLFLNGYADMMNTVLQGDRVVDRINAMQSVIAPEMPEHIDRWNKINSMAEWEDNVQVMRHFALERQEWVTRRLRNHFRGTYDGLPGEMFYTDPDFNFYNLTIENPTPERGNIQVNTIDLAEFGYPWTGAYWRTIPLPITAVPEPGYQFDGFVGYPESAGEDTWHFMLQGHETLTAQFSQATAPGDLNADGVVDVSDLLILLSGWGPCPRGEECQADLTGDGSVDVSDLLMLLSNWG